MNNPPRTDRPRTRDDLLVLGPLHHTSEALGMTVWRWSDNEGRYVQRSTQPKENR